MNIVLLSLRHTDVIIRGLGQFVLIVGVVDVHVGGTVLIKSRDANLWRPKIGRLFFSLPRPPPPHWNFNDSPPRKIDPAPNGNDLGHYNYDVLHDLHTTYVQKCPRNRTANTKNSSFELKMG